jgi:hypothetical protein
VPVHHSARKVHKTRLDSRRNPRSYGAHRSAWTRQNLRATRQPYGGKRRSTCLFPLGLGLYLVLHCGLFSPAICYGMYARRLAKLFVARWLLRKGIAWTAPTTPAPASLAFTILLAAA